MAHWIDMEAQEFFALVKEHFRFLFEKYGFAVVREEIGQSFDFSSIKIQSNSCSISIGRDRGDVTISLRPVSASYVGFSLGDIITFLERRSGTQDRVIWFGPEPKESLNYSDRIRFQLSWYADKLRQYCDQILYLFQEDIFKQRQAELKAWRDFREKYILEAWRQAGKP